SGRQVEPAQHSLHARFQKLFGATAGFVKSGGDEILQHFHIGSGPAEAGDGRRVDGDFEDFLLAVHFYGDGSAAGGSLHNRLAELLLHLFLHLLCLAEHFLNFKRVHGYLLVARFYSSIIRDLLFISQIEDAADFCLEEFLRLLHEWMIERSGLNAASRWPCGRGVCGRAGRAFSGKEDKLVRYAEGAQRFAAYFFGFSVHGEAEHGLAQGHFHFDAFRRFGPFSIGDEDGGSVVSGGVEGGGHGITNAVEADFGGRIRRNGTFSGQRERSGSRFRGWL